MADWRIKALIQKAISALPRSAEANYLLQRYVARTVPISAGRLRVALQTARDHIARYEEFGNVALADAMFYEFGSGWDLHLPVAFFASGVRKQITIDVRRHARVADIRDVIERLPGLLDEVAQAQLASVPIPATDDLDAFLEAFGIEYRAPADARATGLSGESVDCVTSTSVLEHVPAHDIEAILTECWRILRPGGVCSFIIDLDDHFSRYDKSIPANNFLRYAPRRWSLFNPGVAYQNRLRYPDYRDLFDRSDFEVVFDFHRASGFKRLAPQELHEDFRHYSAADIAVSYAHVVLRRPS